MVNILVINPSWQLLPYFSTHQNNEENVSAIVGFKVSNTGLKCVNTPMEDPSVYSFPPTCEADVYLATALLPELQSVDNMPLGGGAQAAVWASNKKTVAQAILAKHPHLQLKTWVWSGGNFQDGTTVIYKQPSTHGR